MSSHTTRATAHPAKPPTNGAPKKPKTVAKKMAQPAYTKTAPGAAPLPLVSIVGAKLTPTGLEMDANLTLEETFDVGKQRVTLERRGPRAMGDWMIDMERLGASDAVMRKRIEAQHLAYGTLHNYKSLARKFPRSRRRCPPPSPPSMFSDGGWASDPGPSAFAPATIIVKRAMKWAIPELISARGAASPMTETTDAHVVE